MVKTSMVCTVLLSLSVYSSYAQEKKSNVEQAIAVREPFFVTDPKAPKIATLRYINTMRRLLADGESEKAKAMSKEGEKQMNARLKELYKHIHEIDQRDQLMPTLNVTTGNLPVEAKKSFKKERLSNDKELVEGYQAAIASILSSVDQGKGEDKQIFYVPSKYENNSFDLKPSKGTL